MPAIVARAYDERPLATLAYGVLCSIFKLFDIAGRVCAYSVADILGEHARIGCVCVLKFVDCAHRFVVRRVFVHEVRRNECTEVDLAVGIHKLGIVNLRIFVGFVDPEVAD